MKPIILPYKMGSVSGKELARAINCKRVFPNGRYRYKTSHIIINWGSSQLPSWHTIGTKYLNNPIAVSIATNKLETYKKFKLASIPHPEFFNSKEDIIHYTVEQERLTGKFPQVYCRSILNGHSGRGITIANNVSEIINAPLYTIRFKAQKEWRIHVFSNKVIDYAKKSRRDGQSERVSGLIRNYSNGWIFKREGCCPSEIIKDTAIAAVAALGLDFGAVDIAEDREGRVCVYEINTACGMQGTTINSYSRGIMEYIR